MSFNTTDFECLSLLCPKKKICDITTIRELNTFISTLPAQTKKLCMVWGQLWDLFKVKKPQRSLDHRSITTFTMQALALAKGSAAFQRNFSIFVQNGRRKASHCSTPYCWMYNETISINIQNVGGVTLVSFKINTNMATLRVVYDQLRHYWSPLCHKLLQKEVSCLQLCSMIFVHFCVT